MVTTSEINSNIGRYGKKTEMFFFSTEATNLIKLKLYMHKYWMSLYKIMFFYVGGKTRWQLCNIMDLLHGNPNVYF